MTNALVLAAIPPKNTAGEPLALTPAQPRLRKMVVDAVQSPHSKRNYAKALDDLFQFCASRPLSRSLLMEWRAGHGVLVPLNYKRPALGCPEDGGRGAAEQPDRDKSGAYSLTTPSGEEHQFAGIVDVARCAAANALG